NFWKRVLLQVQLRFFEEWGLTRFGIGASKSESKSSMIGRLPLDLLAKDFLPIFDFCLRTGEGDEDERVIAIYK
ncbi:hypothetical protein AMTR_s04288p00002900, partial [Amborella trichopoda]